ncbi:MAG: RDD family protein, partial [Terriglobia bacterium]
MSTHADRTYCQECNWTLSRSFSRRSLRLGGNGADRGTTAIQTATDAFVLTPPSLLQRPTPRSRRSARGRRGSHSGPAVATLPAEARWEAPARVEIVEPPLVQSAFDFTTAEQVNHPVPARAAASLAARCQAALLDMALLLAAGGLFVGLFLLLGGAIPLGRRDLLVYLLAGFALAALYFALFTLFGGRTPGMQYHKLRVVTFQAEPLTLRHAAWRAFGYVASTGSLLLGFIWALVDERGLT